MPTVMEPMRRAIPAAPAPPLLRVVESPPVKPVQTRAIRPRRRGGRVRTALLWTTAVLLIAIPMALHGIWRITGSPVLTDSMRPAVRAGDLIVTRPIPASELERGQVAVLDIPGHSLLAHRIVDVVATEAGVEVTTLGDANPSPEAPVTLGPEQMVPVMLFRVPAAGYVAEFFMRSEVLTTGLGLLLLANVLTVVFVLYPRSTVERASGKGGGE